MAPNPDLLFLDLCACPGSKTSLLKPTSAALQLLSVHAEKNVIGLSSEKLEELVEQVEMRGDLAATAGYVIICLGDLPAGCALSLPPGLLSRLSPLFLSENVAGLALRNK